MPQFMIEKKLETGSLAALGGSDAHHIIEVLRLKKGDWLVLSDGKGARYRGTIKNAGKKGVEVLIEEELPKIMSSNITLAQAVIKHDGIEAIIQKAVELGVTKIAPFTSTRTIPKYSDAQKKVERWNKIALEASKQCGLAIRPDVGSIVTLEELLKNAEGFEHKLMFYEGENNMTLGDYFGSRRPVAAGFSLRKLCTLQPKADTRLRGRFRSAVILSEAKNPPPERVITGDPSSAPPSQDDSKIILLIGPEGGFASGEVLLAKKHGFATVKLGPLILRVETAATAAVTLVEYFLGHFN